MKRIISLLIVLTLLMSCACQAASLNPGGTLPLVSEPAELTILRVQNPTVVDYDTNHYTQWLEEQTGLDIKFNFLPSTEAGTKLALMVQSGEKLGDVLNIDLSRADIMAYVDAGVFRPLNDYLQNSSYFMKECYWHDRIEENLPFYTMEDGNIYAYPYTNYAVSNEYSWRAYINKTWLDKLGLEAPKTTDDLVNVLTHFRDDDPNGNGQKDEIPMTGAGVAWRYFYPWLMSAFCYCDPTTNFLLVNDGQLSAAYVTDEWKAGIEFMKSLVDEGLVSPLAFTQDSSQLKSLLLSGDEQSVGFIVDTTLSSMNGDERIKDWDAQAPLQGPYGTAYTIHASSNLPDGGGRAFILSECKDPDLAFALLDFCASDENTLSALCGLEGVDFELIADDDPNYKKLNPNAVYGVKFINDITANSQNSFWGSGALLSNSADTRVAVWSGDYSNWQDPSYQNAMMWKCNEYNFAADEPDELALVLMYTDEEQEIVSTLAADLKTCVEENLTAFVTGYRSLDEWDEFVQEVHAIGLEDYLAIAQTAYDRLYK